MRDRVSALALLLALACAGRSSAPAGPAAPAAGKAPYDATPVSAPRIDISIDAQAAREILSLLSRPQIETADIRPLEELPAVRLAIADSTREPAVFERDFAAAFQPEARAAVFDLRPVREKSQQFQALLEGVLARQADLIRLAARRAAALLPSDRPAAAALEVYLSFGLPGLEDHLVVRPSQGSNRMVLDFARALGDGGGENLEGHVSRLSRLIAGEAFLEAWGRYREESPAWKRSDSQLAQLEPLLKVVAAAGPIGLFTIDESFFPLSEWLKDANKRAVDELNRRAERFASAQENLDTRMELASEVRRPEFGRRVAAPIGMFLADGIAQSEGVTALRAALEQGPHAFFAAYDRASQKNKNLIPLSKAIRDKLK